jgi:hypothetical protein
MGVWRRRGVHSLRRRAGGDMAALTREGRRGGQQDRYGAQES